jgi:hypothetical protein
MPDRKVLNTWKEVAAHLGRGVRTVQRWEAELRMPVHRIGQDRQSVFAYADEIDDWLQRSSGAGIPYVRPTVIVLDIPLPNALSNRKLSMELAKFNVLTAFTAAELLATAKRYDADAFVIDSLIVDPRPEKLCAQLRAEHPNKPIFLLGEGSDCAADHVLPANDAVALVECLLKVLGTPEIIP